ncbi:hypothetical protein MMC29_002577 [Sticta canariensis]|nr:hypothetical protein [Sticta canariensis]
MVHKTAMRSFSFLWYIRLAQVVISFLVLILSAVDAHTVQDYAHGCSVPSKIAYNLACAILALCVLIYFIFSTGPRNPFRSLPWLVWVQLALDGLMWIFWVAAAATSSFSYLDLCDACPVNEVYYSNFLLACNSDAFLDDYDKVYPRGVSPFPRGLAGVEERATAVRRSKGLTAPGRTALDSIMTFLFSICISATIWWAVIQRRSSGTVNSTTKPFAHEESGIPISSTQQSILVAPNPQMHPNQSSVVEGQPQQQQQDIYQQSVPQSQYPSHPQQDFTSQQQ